MADDQATQTAVADDEWDYKPAPKAKGSPDDEWDYHPAQKTAALPAGSYQTKPGGPILNRAGITAQTPKLNEEGPITRAAGAFNEAVGAPRSFAAAAKEPPPSLGRTLLHAVPGFDAAEMAASAYKGMKDTSDYADQYPWGSSANIYNKAESLIPFVGPAISAAARKGAEDPRGFWHALPEMAGTGTGLGLGIASGDPEARAGIMEAPGKIGRAINTGRRAMAEKAVEPLVYENLGETRADTRFGIQPERGVTREGLTGTKRSLAEQAEARTAELKNAADEILRNHEHSNVQIDASPLIDRAIDEAIESSEKTAGGTQHLEDLRQALKTKYGKTKGTPLEMNNLKTEIQKAAANIGSYRNTQPMEATKAAAMADAARYIKDAVNEQVPEAAALNERMADLIDARRGIERNIDAQKGRPVFGNFYRTVPGEILNRTLGSAPVRTGLARGLMAGLVEGIPEGPRPRPALGAPPVVTPLGYPEWERRGEGIPAAKPRGILADPRQVEAEFLPRRVPVQPERAGIGRMLPERTGPETTVPPDVEEPFRREGTGRPDDERTLAGRKGIRQPVRGLLPEAAGQTTPKEPIDRGIPVNRTATPLGRKGLGGKKPAEAPTPKGNPWKTGKSSTDVPDYVKAAAKEAGAMTAGYQADTDGRPGMGSFMFSDTARGGTFNIPEGQVTARAIREKMEARRKTIEPSPLVDEKVENTKREMARREAAEAIPPAPTKTAQEEFSPEQIEDAEYAIRNELEMRQSSDKPGRYPIIESREGNTNPNWQQIVGWRGVGGWKGLQWTKGFTPKEVETALRRRAGKTYDELIRRAARPQEEVEKAGSFNPEELEKPPVRAKQ